MVLNKENRAGFFVVANTKNKENERKTTSSEIFKSKEQANRVLFSNLIVISKKLFKNVRKNIFPTFKSKKRQQKNI